MNKTKFGKSAAKSCALVGTMAAILECAKLALSFIPNVEVVTLFTSLFGFVFGWYGVAAAAVFVCVEPLIYGFGTWIISYYLYWPFVALVFMLLSKARIKNRVILTGAAILLTLWFGILTALVDVGLFSGSYDNLFYRFSVYYVRGIVFYAIQLVTNAVIFPLLFLFLENKLQLIKKRLDI